MKEQKKGQETINISGGTFESRTQRLKPSKKMKSGGSFISEGARAEAGLASCPWRHDRVSQAPNRRRRSYQDQRPKLDLRPLPFDGLCVPKGPPPGETIYHENSK